MAAGEPFYADPTFWVAGSFVTFVGIVFVAKVHKSIASMLDERGAQIGAQIEEAGKLRDEAEKLLIDFRKKQRDAEKEAADMAAQAEEDAKSMAEQAKADIAAMVERRTRVAAEKIATAEAAAVKEVQSVAVSVAVEAASTILADSLKGKAGGTLIDGAIKDLDGKLH